MVAFAGISAYLSANRKILPMRTLLLCMLAICASLWCQAQSSQVSALPAGRYETVLKDNQNKWDRGDITLIDAAHYKISTSQEIGEYRFSVTAQRVFFTSGPLRSLYARTSLSNDAPAIVLPVNENQQMGTKLSAEVWGYYKQ